MSADDRARGYGYRNVAEFLQAAAEFPCPERLTEFDVICRGPSLIEPADAALVDAWERNDRDTLEDLDALADRDRPGRLTSDATRRLLGVWTAQDRAS